MSVVGCAQSHTRKLNRPRVCIYQLTTTAVVACVYTLVCPGACAYIHARLHACLYTVYVQLRVCTAVCTHVCVYKCVYLRTYIRVCGYTRVWACVCAYVVCIHACVCIYAPHSPMPNPKRGCSRVPARAWRTLDTTQNNPATHPSTAYVYIHIGGRFSFLTGDAPRLLIMVADCCGGV